MCGVCAHKAAGQRGSSKHETKNDEAENRMIVWKMSDGAQWKLCAWWRTEAASILVRSKTRSAALIFAFIRCLTSSEESVTDHHPHCGFVSL